MKSSTTQRTENEMNEYHKIQTLFKRDMERNGKTLLEGQWTLPEFEFLAGNTWVFTEKVDGTNIRVMLKDGSVTFGGKTDAAQIPAPLVARLNERFLPLAAKMQEVLGCDACLYGEGYGAKIQKGGGKYRDDQDFVLFDVNIGGWWLQRADVEDVAQKLGLDVVPIIGEGTLHDAIAAAKAGITSTWGNFQAEGIVARPKTELKARNGNRIITKIKCRDFVGSNAKVSGGGAFPPSA
jgi:ATP-dependent RNA circularization protein (DNA/RNA ligase family)